MKSCACQHGGEARHCGRGQIRNVALLQRDGLAALTIDGIAAHARVGKAAIYRRYHSKEELVAAAVEAVLPMAEPVAGRRGPAALAGTDAANADPRVIGELALGGLVARYVGRGAVPPAASRELADELWRLATGHAAESAPTPEDHR